jgi:pilus assembly protein CpaB
MQRGGQLLIVLGLILGLITAGLVYTATRPTEVKIVTQPVVVAVQDIPERVGIEAPMLAVKQWPVDALPTDYISKVEDAVGKASLTKIFAGEPILKGKLVDAKLASQLTFLVPPGMVAFSIPANEVGTVAYAIQPGDYVDVLVSLKVKDYDLKGNTSEEQPTTQLTLQDVKVINVGVWVPPQKPVETSGNQPAAAKAAEPKTITLLVNQQDALVLKYAKEQGMIDLALRGYNDHEKVTTDSVYAAYMLDRFRFNRPPIIPRTTTAPTK